MEFILLLVSSLLLTARAAAAASNPVFDTDGNELRRGRLYYAMSVKRPGDGLTLASPNAERCPLNVAQARFHDYSGLPLAFFPENADDDIVREWCTLNIMFPEPTKCAESTVWTLDMKAGLVSTGGTSSSAVGPQYSRFAIHKAEDASSSTSHHDYQIQVCPCTICAQRATCLLECLGSLGLSKEEENVLLNINNERPHIVKFVRVKQEAAASS